MSPEAYLELALTVDSSKKRYVAMMLVLRER